MGFTKSPEERIFFWGVGRGVFFGGGRLISHNEVIKVRY